MPRFEGRGTDDKGTTQGNFKGDGTLLYYSFRYLTICIFSKPTEKYTTKDNFYYMQILKTQVGWQGNIKEKITLALVQMVRET